MGSHRLAPSLPPPREASDWLSQRCVANQKPALESPGGRERTQRWHHWERSYCEGPAHPVPQTTGLLPSERRENWHLEWARLRPLALLKSAVGSEPLQPHIGTATAGRASAPEGTQPAVDIPLP